MEHVFTHNCTPRVKSRPRRGKGRTYTEKQVVVAEAAIAEDYDGPKFTGPIEVVMEIHKDRWVVTIRDYEGHSNLRGDADNYSKLMLDGLQGVAYDNDSQVLKLTAIKT